jgi:hypothetical protein
LLPVLRSRLQAVTAWLCVVVIALVGVVPAQGLVLCLEPDGSMALEVGSPECGGCAETEGGHEGIDSAAHEEGCPCVDIPIFSLGEENQLQAKNVELRLGGSWMAAPQSSAVLPVLLVEPRGTNEATPPRPSSLLALIRTVVLLV